ncbi:MAG: hypothetical protein H0W62_12365 [Chitinophagales bacterium]|nr:hypothetical protein [Chitinophagales bacterium]
MEEPTVLMIKMKTEVEASFQEKVNNINNSSPIKLNGRRCHYHQQSAA